MLKKIKSIVFIIFVFINAHASNQGVIRLSGVVTRKIDVQEQLARDKQNNASFSQIPLVSDDYQKLAELKIKTRSYYRVSLSSSEIIDRLIETKLHRKGGKVLHGKKRDGNLSFTVNSRNDGSAANSDVLSIQKRKTKGLQTIDEPVFIRVTLQGD